MPNDEIEEYKIPWIKRFGNVTTSSKRGIRIFSKGLWEFFNLLETVNQFSYKQFQGKYFYKRAQQWEVSRNCITSYVKCKFWINQQFQDRSDKNLRNRKQ